MRSIDIVAIAMALAWPLMAQAQSNAAPVSASFAPLSFHDRLLPNPDRGGAGYAGSDIVNKFDAGSFNNLYSSGLRLAYCPVDLTPYRTSNLPASFLEALNARLETIRAAGMKCYMVIAYGPVHGGQDTEASWIRTHLSQLGGAAGKPLWDNADVIPFAKAGFVGQYGEWWGSRNGNSCGFDSGETKCETAIPLRRQLRDAILAAYHPTTQVQFRYPDDIAKWHPKAATMADVAAGGERARAGFHNDCPLSGPGTEDTGTWVGRSSGMSNDALKTYMEAATEHISYGGELANNCAVPHRTSCSEAREDFARWHLAVLKFPGPKLNWRQSWESGGCLTEIANRIGYRFQFSSLTLPGAAARGDSVTATVQMRNVGWSRLFFARKLQMVLTNGAESIVCESRVSLQSLPSQAQSDTAIQIPCAIPASAAPGNWSVKLRMPDTWPALADKAAFAIRPANADSANQGWDAANFRFDTGLSIKLR